MGVLLNKLLKTQGGQRPEEVSVRTEEPTTRWKGSVKSITKHAELPDEFINWMSKYVDWEVESRIGYYRREVLKSKNV